MKKKICLMVLAICMTASMVACQGSTSKTDTSSKTEAQDTEKDDQSEDTKKEADEVTKDTRIVSVSADDMDKYVKLGEYKGIAVAEEVEEVTDEAVDTQIQTTLSQSPVEVTDENATVKDGDIVNINYVGTKDGEAFDGGTADDYDLTIGSGSFIDGFEDGLIGAKKGETKELNLTFPEGYQSEELAGQDVIFTVTINAIKTTPELTEEWVKENSEYDTIDAYKESVAKDLKKSNEESARTTALNNAWDEVLGKVEITEYPKEDLDAALKEYNDSLSSYAEQQNMTVEEFLEAQSMTQEEFDKQAQEYSEYKVKQDLAVQAIMDKEGFTLVDDECKDAQDQLVANYGVDDISVLVDQYGQTAINEAIAMDRVTDFVMDNAKVTSSVATDDDKEGFDADAAEEAAAEDNAAN